MTPDSMFGLICYHILVSPVEDKSPDYLNEKTAMLAMSGFSAFTFLDHKNQGRCLNYCARWHVPVPAEVKVYWQETQQAITDLSAQGFEL